MSLETILKKIIDDAQHEADGVLRESRKRAGKIKEEARREAAELAEALVKEGQRQGELEAIRLVTQARLKKKIEILAFRRQLIDRVLEQAFQAQRGGSRALRRTIVMKEGEKDEVFDEKRLKEELRPHLENEIAKLLKI